jgi:hypothetical protein
MKTKALKPGTRVRFTEKHLRFLRSGLIFDVYMKNGVISDRQDFEKAAAARSIGLGAPYKAEVIRGGGIDIETIRVRYKVGKTSDWGYYYPSDVEEI